MKGIRFHRVLLPHKDFRSSLRIPFENNRRRKTMVVLRNFLVVRQLADPYCRGRGQQTRLQRRSRKTVALLLPPNRKSYDSVYSSVTQSSRAVIVRSDLICQLAPRNTRNNYTSLFLVVLVLCCFPQENILFAD